MKKSSRTTDLMIPKSQKSQKKFRTDVRTYVRTGVRTDVRVEWRQYPIRNKLCRVKSVPKFRLQNVSALLFLVTISPMNVTIYCNWSISCLLPLIITCHQLKTLKQVHILITKSDRILLIFWPVIYSFSVNHFHLLSLRVSYLLFIGPNS